MPVIRFPFLFGCCLAEAATGGRLGIVNAIGLLLNELTRITMAHAFIQVSEWKSICIFGGAKNTIVSKTSGNFKFQQIITLAGLILFAVKITAWYLTGSVAILTDALESIVNVFSAFLGLYSLYLSAKPRDSNHPYGHGKVEFVSAAIEGTLISVAGLIIIFEAIVNLQHPHELKKMDTGMVLIALAAAVNYVLGFAAIRKGNKTNSLALIASGKHLQSDTWSTAGILAGLGFMAMFKWSWIDSAVALVFSFLILFTGYKIIRDSIAGIMDEADERLLKKLVETLEQNRAENWVDLHNLRIIKYGSTLHLDCHLTVPWYFNIHEAHSEIDKLDALVRRHYGDSLEMFIHTDGCMDFSCAICNKSGCRERKEAFRQRISWTVENISGNRKHRIY